MSYPCLDLRVPLYLSPFKRLKEKGKKKTSDFSDVDFFLFFQHDPENPNPTNITKAYPP